MSVSVKDDIILDLNIGCDHLDMGALLAKQDELFGSSDHRAEAISELNKSLVYFRRITAVDPSEEETRINTGEGATELGRLLQESSPAAALGSYNEAIKALSAMPAKNERRNFPLSSVLSESVFALNRLGRIPEAEKRLADAKALLAGSTAPDFENGESLRNPFEALSRAESNQLASSGHYLDAIRMDTAWLRAVESKPQILQVRLTDALIVAARYQQLASVCRKAGQIEEEQTALRKRQELLAAWIQKVHSFPAY
jgi:tetratricopeptide (TPR) repeat protein